MLDCKFDCDMTGPEWAFRRLMHVHHTAHAAVFDRLGLRDIGQPMLLFVLNDLRREGKRCAQKDLADFLDRAPSTVAVSMSSLEKRGYVRRGEDERDKRRKYVEITEEGAAVAEKCRRAFDDIDGAMFAGFSAEEKLRLVSDFHRIIANLTALAGGEQEAGPC